jgi:hypothetical protein
MSEQNQNTPKQSLDDQIEELVTEMSEATEKLNKQTEEASLSDEDFDLKAQIGSGITTEEASTQRSQEAAAAQSESAEPAEVPGETLDGQIDEMLTDAESSAEDQEPQPASAVDAVNAELAELAEEMLDGDFDDAENVIEKGIEPETNTPEPSAETVEPETGEVKADQPATESSNAVDAVDAELAGLAEEMLDGDFDDADDLIQQGIDPHKPESASADDDAESEPAEGTNGAASPESTVPLAETAEVATGADDPDDLLDGDFDDAEDVIEQGISAEINAPHSDSESQQEDAAEPETLVSSAEPAAPAKAEPKSAEPAADPVSESPSVKADEPETKTKTKPAKQKKSKQSKQKKIVEPKSDSKLPAYASVAAAQAGGLAFSLAEKMNKPLDEKPVYMRDIAGWLAAVTLFNAVAAWFFLLFLRSPAAGSSSEPTVELVGGTTTQQVESEPVE